MAKKSKPHTGGGSTKKIYYFKNFYRRTGKNGSLILVLFTIAVIFFVSNQLAVYKEKSTFNNAEKQINQFLDQASKLVPNNKEIRNYCNYTSEKFSTGSLGCSVSATLEYLPVNNEKLQRITQTIYNNEKSIGWKYLGENTQGNKKYISENYLRSKIYQIHSLTCGVHYKYKEDNRGNIIYIDGNPILTVEASCSGPALREYY